MPTENAKRDFVFGEIFIISNKLNRLLEQELKVFDITFKQWFLLAALNSYVKYSPTITELADIMGSSYQNVKQIALKLESKNLLSIEKDPSDHRKTRLVINNDSEQFWRDTHVQGEIFLRKVFDGVDEDSGVRFFNALESNIKAYYE